MSGIWCSLQRACTSFLYIGSLQFSARTHSKACRLQQQFHSNYHTASLTTPSTHKLHCTDSLYLLDHPPTVVLLMNMIKETNCAYRLQTVSLTNCPHMYGLHVKTRATAVLSIMIVWKTIALQIQNSITWYYSPPHDMFIAATHKWVASYATTPSSPTAGRRSTHDFTTLAKPAPAHWPNTRHFTKTILLYQDFTKTILLYQLQLLCIPALHCANAITLREITINNYTIIVTTTRGVNCKSYNESTPQNTLKQLIYAVHTHYNWVT